ncbi:hypothetical protein PLANPX_1849 [Lacipirellula parvula]|uniref:Uncharacterized protein n=1 Tax=Lacipirellula parvula TaxID=2650471 RepID=A0A5K7X8Q0_9BACT|nr:hypothetical protein PLANPX_1849 [Lacipirellula parvula]
MTRWKSHFGTERSGRCAGGDAAARRLTYVVGAEAELLFARLCDLHTQARRSST